MVVAAGIVRSREDHDAHQRFRYAASQRFALLDERMHAALGRLRALGGYLDAHGPVDAAHFDRLTRPLLGRGAPIQALEWIPRVAQSQRATLEATARRDGFPDYCVRAQNAQGQLIPEGPRPQYYPVLYVQPLAGNRQALGFDLASRPSRRDALKRAMRTARLQATRRIRLVQAASGSFGFLVFRPVYAGGVAPATAARRAASLEGFALGVFRVDQLLAGASSGGPSSIRLRAIDDNAPAGQRTLYPAGSAPAASPVGATDMSHTLRVAGRNWTLRATPAPGAFVPDHAGSSAVLALGLLASLLWGVYVRQRASRLASIEQAVEDRTRDLEEQRGFANAIFDTLGGVGLVIDRDGAIVRFNKAAEDFTGREEAEIRGKPLLWRDFLPPEERASVEQVFTGLAQASVPANHENHWVDRHGNQHLFAWTNTILRDAQGEARYLITTGLDITESRRAAAALRASEQRYRQFFENNTAIKLVIDPASGLITDANSAAIGFYGYARERLLGMRIHDINCLSAQEIEEELARARDEHRQHFQFRHRLASGAVRDVEVYSGPSVADGRTLLYSIVHDVTERRKALQLQDALLENTTSGILVAQRRTLVAVNSAMLQMLGRTKEEVVGGSARMLYPDDEEFSRVGSTHGDLLAHGTASRANVRLLAAGGRVLCCDLRGRLLPDGETAVWTFTDVGEREEQARSMQRSQGVYRALVAAAQSLLHSATEAGMINRLCQSLVAGSEFCAVWLGHPDDQGFFRAMGRASATREGLSFIDHLRIPVDDADTAIAQAWNGRTTVIHQDNLARKQASPFVADLQRLQWASTLATVVCRGGRPWGALVYVSRQADWFDDTSRDACEQVAALLGHGLDERDHKAMLSKLQARESQRARTDPLTGLPNRLALGEHLPGALARAQRRGTVVAVGVLDLDDFKPVNDRYGHPAGDELLRRLATALRKRLRRSDYLARLGGDEFVVLFEDIEAQQARAQLQAALDRLHGAVECVHDLGAQRLVRVGMTMGLALYPQHAEEADALLRLADAAMYFGKAHKVHREHWWMLCDNLLPAAAEPTRELELDPFGAEAQALLAAVDNDMLRGVAASFTAAFYAELEQSPEFGSLLRGLGDAGLEHLKQAQSEHLLFLLDRNTSRQALEQEAHRVGVAHALVGVSSARIEKGFGLYEDLLRSALENAPFSARERYRLMRVSTSRLRLDVLTQLDAVDHTMRLYSELLNASVASGERWLDVLPAILQQIGSLPGIPYAILFRPDEHGFLVDEMASGAGSARLCEALRARSLFPNLNPPPGVERGPVSAAWFAQDVQIVDSYRSDAHLARWHQLSEEFGWRSAATIPVVHGDTTEGVLMLFGAYPMQFSSEWTRPWLRAMHNRLNAVFSFTARGYQPIAAARLRQYRELLYGNGLRMWCQPIVDLQSGAVVKVEALARLQADDGSLHGPAQFLPAFGEQQLQTLFLQGLAQALELLHGWRDEGLGIDVSVNLAPSTLLHPDCALWVENALREARVAAEHLTLEVLESENLDRKHADEAIHALRALGVHIALDDLGAGYSSLTRLASLPIHTVKIDQALVRELPQEPLRTVRLLATLLRIGQEFAPVTVVEGLEDEGLVEAVRLLGATFGQGYGIARPMPAAELRDWLHRRGQPTPDGSALRTWPGALAYHWRAVHDRAGGDVHPGGLQDCPLTHFLRAHRVDDRQALAWHARYHEASGADERMAAADALLGWLAQIVRQLAADAARR